MKVSHRNDDPPPSGSLWEGREQGIGPLPYTGFGSLRRGKDLSVGAGGREGGDGSLRRGKGRSLGADEREGDDGRPTTPETPGPRGGRGSTFFGPKDSLVHLLR